MKKIIIKYNSWVYGLSKVKYRLLILAVTILESLALIVLPAAIDKNYNNLTLKISLIFPLLLIINYTVHMKYYKEYN